jgi:hypothetical protein
MVARSSDRQVEFLVKEGNMAAQSRIGGAELGDLEIFAVKLGSIWARWV